MASEGLVEMETPERNDSSATQAQAGKGDSLESMKQKKPKQLQHSRGALFLDVSKEMRNARV